MDSLKNRKQFKFYRSYFDIISELENDTDKLNYLLSILEFQFNGIEIPLQGMAKFAFKSQKHSLDRQLKGFIDATLPYTPTANPIDIPLGGADSIPIEHTPIGIINNKEIIKNKEVKKEIKNTCLTFESFWELYDKKVDSKKCKDKFNKVKESDRQKILDTLPNYIKSTPDIKFRKNPSTYLNNECWNDTVEIIESTYPKTIAEEHEENMYKSSLSLVERGMRTPAEHNEVMKTNKMDLKYYLPL